MSPTLFQVNRLLFVVLLVQFQLLTGLRLFVALGGVNLKQLMDDAADEVGGKLLLDFKDTAGDRIQVFLE